MKPVVNTIHFKVLALAERAVTRHLDPMPCGAWDRILTLARETSGPMNDWKDSIFEAAREEIGK